MMCKTDKRFAGHIAYIQFEATKKGKKKYKLVKIEKASIFSKDSDNLILIHKKHADAISRWRKKKMLIIIEVKKLNPDEGKDVVGGISKAEKKEEAPKVQE